MNLQSSLSFATCVQRFKKTVVLSNKRQEEVVAAKHLTLQYFKGEFQQSF